MIVELEPRVTVSAISPSLSPDESMTLPRSFVHPALLIKVGFPVYTKPFGGFSIQPNGYIVNLYQCLWLILYKQAEPLVGLMSRLCVHRPDQIILTYLTYPIWNDLQYTITPLEKNKNHLYFCLCVPKSQFPKVMNHTHSLRHTMQ